MWVMISGPYRHGARTDEDRRANLRRMNEAAVEILRKGHTPVIGVNMALPMIESAGAEAYDEIMMPVSLALAERCDAVLRMGGASTGADQEAQRFVDAGKPVYRSVDEIPAASVSQDMA